MEQFVVSARKYRPQTFKDVVGQSAITNTLLNAIENNHLASALLFTGPRGVGKTTCARILARKINQPDYDDPYEDFSFNVFELDAASNNSVDDIRNLIEQVRIPPQTGKYKVYVIDEVHMLSSAAFNAFLKTLEEPPAHAIFILATTEKHKIIPTILSRCQIFDFKRITVKDAKEHLAEVAKSQDIIFEDDALHIIAQKADGAMRDALSIFDRVVSFSGKNLTRQAVTENLNVLDYETYIRITDLIVENKIPDILLNFNTILEKGFDAHHFIAGLASHFRDLLVCKNPATLTLLEIGEQAQKMYQEQAQKCSQNFLLKGISIANDCDLKYKVSQNQRLLVELCLMQLASIEFDGEKKKAEFFIIPPTYFRAVSHSIVETIKPSLPTVDLPKIVENIPITTETSTIDEAPKIKAFSLSSIKAKKEVLANQTAIFENPENLPTQLFTETDMRLTWHEYSKKLGKKGYKIMESLLRISSPILKGTTIFYELPNEGSKIDFESEKNDLTLYLRKKLNNHDINIEVTVNESIEAKYVYTDAEKFAKLNTMNKNLELLKRTFDLDF